MTVCKFLVQRQFACFHRRKEKQKQKGILKMQFCRKRIENRTLHGSLDSFSRFSFLANEFPISNFFKLGFATLRFSTNRYNLIKIQNSHRVGEQIDIIISIKILMKYQTLVLCKTYIQRACGRYQLYLSEVSQHVVMVTGISIW